MVQQIDSGRKVSAEARFRQLYGEHWDAVLGYALRRTQRPEDAADVVADSFLVAWRRIEQVPAEPATRIWLYGVARRVLANQRRGERRRDRLADRLRQEVATAVAAAPPPSADSTAIRVLGRMDEGQRELLMLAGWEELTPAEIAAVLGISAVAARNRLHRARKQFKRELEAERREAPASTQLGVKGA